MRTLLFLFTIISAASCCNINPLGISGSGNVTKETRNTGSFNSLNLSVLFDVVIIPSAEEKVVIETDDNLQRFILVEKEGEVLTIKMGPKRKLYNRSQGKIFVYAKKLKLITNSSIGTLTNESVIRTETLTLNNSAVGKTTLNVETKKMMVNNNSVGILELDGSSDDLIIKNKAVGEFKAFGLHCNNLDIDNKAIGKTTVFVNNECTINNSGIGTLDVYGKGEIKKINNSGIGKFQKH